MNYSTVRYLKGLEVDVIRVLLWRTKRRISSVRPALWFQSRLVLNIWCFWLPDTVDDKVEFLTTEKCRDGTSGVGTRPVGSWAESGEQVVDIYVLNVVSSL